MVHTTRAAQRKQRLIQIENEMRQEDAEALKMTEEERETLLRSFTSVKVEFSDLDGLAWPASARCGGRGAPPPPSPRPSPRAQSQSPDHKFVILTNADLASFAPHETIRASAGTRPRPRSSVSSPNLSSAAHPHHTLKHSYSALSSPSATIKAILKGKTSHPRSPVKGLFPPQNQNQNSDPYESDGERTVRGGGSDSDSDQGSRSPRPRKERKKSKSHSGRASRMSPSLSSPVLGSPKPSYASSPQFAESHMHSGGYPAYITYSPSPSLSTSTSPSPALPPLNFNIPRISKPSIFPPASKPGHATAISHLLRGGV
ncbi:hypothetical protein LshimejAT787_0605150 [Lyophyllum shimeji]|uniref:Uncharacterized protein n=1 Tax=Lyophyllum shimeji TaxID=47721 RepID=A0A9P3UN65_LYOSH|nr:hypothetical protein LshimejAT787_0605150 [Lyophyllum shimeji]